MSEVLPPEGGSGDADVKVDVFFVDTGETETLPLCDLRPMRAQFFTDPPFAAVECVLAHVLPPGDGGKTSLSLTNNNCLSSWFGKTSLLMLSRLV